jgi:hypothetical protein
MTKSKILEQIKYWKETFQPVNNMGKWYASIRIQKLTEQLEKRNKKNKSYDNKTKDLSRQRLHHKEQPK